MGSNKHRVTRPLFEWTVMDDPQSAYNHLKIASPEMANRVFDDYNQTMAHITSKTSIDKIGFIAMTRPNKVWVVEMSLVELDGGKASGVLAHWEINTFTGKIDKPLASSQNG